MGRAEQKSPAPRRLAVVAALAAGLGLVGACSAGQVTQTDTQVAVVNGASGTLGSIAVRDAQLQFPVEHGYFAEGDDATVVVVVANDGTAPDKLLSVTSDATGEGELTGDVELEPGTAILAGEDQDGDSGHSATSSASATSGSSATSVTSTPAGTPSGSVTSTTAPTSSSATTGSPTGVTSGTGSSSISNPPSTSAKTPSSVEPTEPGKLKIVLKGFKRDLRPGETIKVTFLFENAGPLTLDLPIGATPEPREEGASEH